MLPAFTEDDRPTPLVGALGALALLMIVAGVVLVFQRAGEENIPQARSQGFGKIVFASNREADMDIYVVNNDGSGRDQLTDSRSVDSQPAWSPDGTKIAFESDRDGNVEIYVM